jgi:hypothetical protein
MPLKIIVAVLVEIVILFGDAAAVFALIEGWLFLCSGSRTCLLRVAAGWWRRCWCGIGE